MKRSRPRIAVGGFSHETHSFSPVRTTLEDFMRRASVGHELISRTQGTRTGMGGFIDAAENLGIELVPIVSAGAGPAGPVTREAYRAIKEAMLSGIRKALPLDGVLLSLHGAMVAEGLEDPEGDLIASIRSLVGGETIIGGTFDLHGNISRRMVRDIDLLFAYKTYPHVDSYEQAVSCVESFLDVREGRLKPTRFVEKLPWMPHSMNMGTDRGPMAEIVMRASEWEESRGVVNVSVFGGFPWSDTFCVGFTVVVTTDDDRALARDVARDIARFSWNRRERFTVDWMPLDEAMSEAAGATDTPIVLVDAADNPGSGGTGDTTVLLQAMADRNPERGVVSLIRDPETVAHAAAVGVGNEGDFNIGGKTDPRFGAPVHVRARVRTLSDGTFILKGPMSRGAEASVGRVAVLNMGGLDILVSEVASSTNDPELLRRHGIEPRDRSVLALKVKNHFRAAFEPLVARIINVDVPGLAGRSFAGLNYRSIPRPMYPLDEDVGYPR